MAKKKLDKGLKIVVIAVAAILGIGAVAGIARGAKDETTLNRWFNYEVAAVNEEGEFEKDAETNIVSDLVEVEGMKVEIDKNDDLTFEVHFYDEDEKYLSSTAALTEFDAQAEDTVLPEGAKYARVEFTHADDDEISFDEMLEYLGDVTITLTKVEKK